MYKSKKKKKKYPYAFVVQGNILGELSICLTVGPQWVQNDKHIIYVCIYILLYIYLHVTFLYCQ